jgi:hypothetical protein
MDEPRGMYDLAGPLHPEYRFDFQSPPSSLTDIHLSVLVRQIGRKKKNEIRLLQIQQKRLDIDQIQCDIFPVSLDKAPPYKALSYAWGDPMDISSSISLDRRIFLVWNNL